MSATLAGKDNCGRSLPHFMLPVWAFVFHTHAQLWLLLGSPGEREAEVPCSKCTLLYSVFSNAHSSTEPVMSPSKQRERGMCQWVRVFSAVLRVSPPLPWTCSLGKVARINIKCIKGGKDMVFGENSLIMWSKEVSSVPGLFIRKPNCSFCSPPESWGLHNACTLCFLYRSINITGHSGCSGGTHLPWNSAETRSDLVFVASLLHWEWPQAWVISDRKASEGKELFICISFPPSILK